MAERLIEELAALVQRAKRAVIFTGAGISTDAGIPDFRSANGFWKTNRPIEYQDFIASPQTRMEAWRRFFMIRDRIATAGPGRAHRAVAELVARGHVSSIITQNIDDLHARAGIAPDRIIEIHGNGTYAKCLSCGARHELDWARAHLNTTGRPPDCLHCGGIVKSATISFGQAMPEQAMADARAVTFNADLFLAMGSSLQVFPAAGFPVMAKHNRTPLVIINREATGLDGLADCLIHDDIAETLERLIARLPG